MARYFLSFLIPFVIALTLTPLAKRIGFRFKFLDQPGHRKIHNLFGLLDDTGIAQGNPVIRLTGTRISGDQGIGNWESGNPEVWIDGSRFNLSRIFLEFWRIANHANGGRGGKNYLLTGCIVHNTIYSIFVSSGDSSWIREKS